MVATLVTTAQAPAAATATPTGGFGSAPENTWEWVSVPGSPVSGCGKDATSCVFKADSSTGTGYAVLCINGSYTQQGPWESCDYYGVPAKGVGVIEGHITDKDGGPVAGVDVTAYGKHSAGAVSGPDGFYAMQANVGSYRVLPSGGFQGKSAPSYSPKIIDATTADGATTTADFRLLAGIELQLHFAKSSVPADGTEVVNGTITTTEFGKPLPNVTVQLEVMPGETAAEAVTSAPRATVCNSGSRLWPTGTMASPDGFPVTVTTDATGHYDLAITVGTTPGTWSLDAWVENSDGTLSTDTTAASETQSIKFTRLGSVPLSDFISEFDLAAKSTKALSQVSSMPSVMVSALAQVTSTAAGGTKLGGLAYGLVQAKEGQSVIVFSAEKPPVIDSAGALPTTFAANADDLVIDPAEWTGAGLPAKFASLQAVLDGGGLLRAPTLTEFGSGAPVPAWKTVAHNEIYISSQSFEYLGWGYAGIGAPGPATSNRWRGTGRSSTPPDSAGVLLQVPGTTPALYFTNAVDGWWQHAGLEHE